MAKKGGKKGKALARAEQAGAMLAALERQLDALERRFEAVMGGGRLLPPELDLQMPRMDVLDKGRKLVVRAEVPGMKKEDLEVKVSDFAVTIRGSTRSEKKQEKGDYIQREIVTGSFVRTIPLPEAVDADGARAKVKNGVLHLVLPKAKKKGQQAVRVK